MCILEKNSVIQPTMSLVSLNLPRNLYNRLLFIQTGLKDDYDKLILNCAHGTNAAISVSPVAVHRSDCDNVERDPVKTGKGTILSRS